MEESEKEALKQKLKDALEAHFGNMDGKMDAEISQIFWDTYFVLTRLLKRDIFQETKPPKVVKLDFVEPPKGDEQTI